MIEKPNNFQPSIREIQRKPYTRLTEAMSEVAIELNQARELVRTLEMQYRWMEQEYAQTQVYHPIITNLPSLQPDQS